MVAEISTDELPPGWKEYVKVKNGRRIKYYSKAKNGQKLYSKKAVMRYVNLKSDGNDTLQPRSDTDGNDSSQPQNNHRKSGSKSKVHSGAEEANKSPAWLPPGWTMEEKSRKGGGATYKIYIDPATGSKFYSKPQVSQYLETLALKEDRIKQNTNTIGGQSSLREDVHKDHRLGESHSCLSKKEESNHKQQTTPIVCSNEVESSSVDGLPVGWRKEIKTRRYANGIKKDPYYIDPVNGYVFRSKKDALRYVETGDISKCAIKPKKRDETDTLENVSSPTVVDSTPMKGLGITEKEEKSITKHSAEAVVSDQVKSTSVDGLPPGWIKEVKARGDASGKKDPYYTDPISGYMFRSKKDALRYIETGDISKCASKPKKRDAHDASSTKLVSSTSTPCDGRHSLQSSSRQLFVGEELSDGKEIFDASIFIASEAKSSKRKHGGGLTIDAVVTETITEVPAKKQVRRKEKQSRKSSQITEQEPIGSGQTEYRTACDPGTDCTDEKKFSKDTVDRETCRNTPEDSRSSSKRIAQRVPGRTSKRLSGHEPEMPLNLQLSERSLRAAIRNSSGDEADILTMITMTSDAHIPAQALHSVHSELSEDMNEQKNRRTVTKSKKSSKIMAERISPSTPGRTSKRLAGCQPEMPSNLQVSEQSLRAAIKKYCEDEAHMLPLTAMNAVPTAQSQPLHCELSSGTAIGRSREGESCAFGDVNPTDVSGGLLQPLNTEAAPGYADIVSKVVESIFKMDEDEESEEPSREGQVVSEEKTEEQINEKDNYKNPESQNVQGGHSFMDQWSDPCLDFAFKTLTGDLPIEDTLAYQGCSKGQKNSPSVQRDGYFGQSQSGSSNFGYSQDGMSSHSNSVRLHVGGEHSTGNPTPSPPFPGFSLHNIGATSSQQISSESRNKDYNRNAGTDK